MHHVFSTMANSTDYIKFADTIPGGVNVPERMVTIQGGAGINRKNIATPLGVHTAVSDEDMAWLKDHPCFKDHIAKGQIVVRKTSASPEAVAADMPTRPWLRGPDGKPIRGDAFPVVPNDYDLDGDKEVVKPMTSKKGKKAA